VARVVYFANGHDVRDVVVDGQVLLQDGVAPHLDAAAITAAAWRESEAMLDRAGLRGMVAEDPGWGLTRR
jgi:hypothetical protein